LKTGFPSLKADAQKGLSVFVNALCALQPEAKVFRLGEKPVSLMNEAEKRLMLD